MKTLFLVIKKNQWGFQNFLGEILKPPIVIISSTDSKEEQINELLELKAYILSHRFFGASQTIPKSLEYRLNLLSLPSSEFRQAFRMNKDTFLFILNHPVFSNNSFNKQQPVWVQLLVVLERFGFDGNASSIGKVARSLGLGNGTVVLYTSRVIQAILSIHNQFIKWVVYRSR